MLTAKKQSVMELFEQGFSYREIGRLVGLSHSRVGQIVLGVKGRKVSKGSRTYRTRRRDELYRFIAQYKTEHDGNSPTLAEMMAIGYASKSAIYYALRVLEKQGKIRVVKGEGHKSQIYLVGGSYLLPERLEG